MVIDRTTTCSVLERPKRPFGFVDGIPAYCCRPSAAHPGARRDPGRVGLQTAAEPQDDGLGRSQKRPASDGADVVAHAVEQLGWIARVVVESRPVVAVADVAHRQRAVPYHQFQRPDVPQPCENAGVADDSHPSGLAHRPDAARDPVARGPAGQRPPDRGASVQRRRRMSHLLPVLPAVSEPHPMLRPAHLLRVFRADQAT